MISLFRSSEVFLQTSPFFLISFEISIAKTQHDIDISYLLIVSVHMVTGIIDIQVERLRQRRINYRVNINGKRNFILSSLRD